MSRALLGGLGVAALVLAVALRAPPAGDGDATAALGRSLGGLRVMVIDALFLRAEAQRKAGRVEDAAALYETVLELDPRNEAAAAFLAATYVDELMPQVADDAERFAWWREARALLAQALAQHPGSAGLHTRLAALLVDVPLADPALAPHIARAVEQPRRQALRHLDAAARARATLPRLGRAHLVRLALLAPQVAGEALAEGDLATHDEALRIGRRTLALRGEVLAEVRPDELGADLARLLRAGLAAAQAVGERVIGRGAPGAAEQAIAAYEALLPASGLPARLRRVLANPERRER